MTNFLSGVARVIEHRKGETGWSEPLLDIVDGVETILLRSRYVGQQSGQIGLRIDAG